MEQKEAIRKALMETKLNPLDELELWLQRHEPFHCITQYLYHYEIVVDKVTELFEEALESEDYEFCAKLKGLQEMAEQKHTLINQSIDFEDFDFEL